MRLTSAVKTGFIGALLLTGCTRQDREKPVARILNFPDTLWVKSGDTLHLEMHFTDNDKLAQYKIDIHNDFDGHNHPKIYRARPWSRIIIGSLSGREQFVHQDVTVFDSAAAGPYHLMLRAVDASGNESEFVLKNLYVQNAHDSAAPVVSEILWPAEGSIVSGNLELALDLSDDYSGIYLIHTTLRRSATQILYSASDTLLNQPLNFTYGLVIPITTQMPTGQATLRVDVYDGAFNRTRLQNSININL